MKAARPVGRAVNDWFACTPATLCLPDDRKACEIGFRGARFFVDIPATVAAEAEARA